MSLTNNPGSDKGELIRSLTKALGEPCNENDDGKGYHYVVDAGDNNEDNDDKKSQSSNLTQVESSSERKTSEKVSLLSGYYIKI